ncbi:RNA polymerase sigma-70 factor [Chitinophagaceae bacterium LB-8]|uniref:RNA polymerase sigma-70 factor n=1 Tax=Paraflavisolibacter caeni TaxID=2982496 RepID=A0A9X2XVD3_9BACT|nr:RNA polymerase sigma-70 factor [Paraflavisolibacter caeni]MCU7549660.1 RNA polymerase sigma-70 factor [Paraflavisolibacter caeni]
MNHSSFDTQEEYLGAEANKEFEYLFKLYYSRLCYFAFNMIEDKDASEDIVQDVFIKFWKQRSDFDHELSIKTFLYVSVRNACINRIRHEKVEKKFIKAQNSEEVEEEKGLQQMIKAEVLGEIYNAIEELPQGCRQVLKLAYFEGLKNHEIAEQLGISVNTIKTQKARALQLLRLKLDLGAFTCLLVMLSHQRC